MKVPIIGGETFFSNIESLDLILPLYQEGFLFSFHSSFRQYIKALIIREKRISSSEKVPIKKADALYRVWL